MFFLDREGSKKFLFKKLGRGVLKSYKTTCFSQRFVARGESGKNKQCFSWTDNPARNLRLFPLRKLGTGVATQFLVRYVSPKWRVADKIVNTKKKFPLEEKTPEKY
jgi:hypothetical protein